MMIIGGIIFPLVAAFIGLAYFAGKAVAIVFYVYTS